MAPQQGSAVDGPAGLEGVERSVQGGGGLIGQRDFGHHERSGAF
jgi:hypothetical protein